MQRIISNLKNHFVDERYENVSVTFTKKYILYVTKIISNFLLFLILMCRV